MFGIYSYSIIALVILVIIIHSVHILREYERGVIFLLGRF